VPRPLNTKLPPCPDHPGSSVRSDGRYGTPPRSRLRCFYLDEDGVQRKHGLRPPPKPAGRWDELPGGRYTVNEVATALADVARGVTYTEAARRAQVSHAWDTTESTPEPSALDGRLVAYWLDRFSGPTITAYAETSWPQTLVLDSTEFLDTSAWTGDREQLFTVLAAWGYPGGARRGRLWALEASPSDDKQAWLRFLRQLPGRPEMVVYDSDKAIHAAVKRKWPTVPIHLCEHHLYVNAKKRLREDGQEGWGNTYRTLLAAAGQSPEGWAAFRQAVHAVPELTKTGKWVRHWDRQMTAQTGRRATAPPHYSTGALDPQIAVVRQLIERRVWTFRNLARMNALLGLVRLHVNRRDVPADWAELLADHLRDRPTVNTLIEEPVYLLDGSREYSLRKHPVPAKT
jgi:hypothetical protein